MVKLVGIHTRLPLPTGWEMLLQLLVYFIVEDFSNYWIYRFFHCKWGYENIHRVHHEYTAPIGFAAPCAHWAEVLVLGIPSFLGPAMVPGHMITFWAWIALRQIEAIETHSGKTTIYQTDIVTEFLEVYRLVDVSSKKWIEVGAADYIAMARSFHTVFISDIPIMSMRIRDKARRFITLIDELYNNHCCLYCTADSSIEDLFQGTDEGALFDLESFQFETETEGAILRRDVLAEGGVKSGRSPSSIVSLLSSQEEMFTFRRAVSRLIEMQTPLYLEGVSYLHPYFQRQKQGAVSDNAGASHSQRLSEPARVLVPLSIP